MNKIDIILIYLIIIISFVCIIKIYLNNKKIERFYTFDRQFSGVMKFVDNSNPDVYLGSYPDKFHDCFVNNTCTVNGINYEYTDNKIKIEEEGDSDIDKRIDVTTIRLPKGDQGDNGMDALKPTIKFYYIDSNGNNINDDGNSITVVNDEDSHEPFHESSGDDCLDSSNCPDEIKVNVTRHDNCTPIQCDTCTGNTSINTITSLNGQDAVTVNGNINTKNIILNEGGKICINNENEENCLDYDDIQKLLQWNTLIGERVIQS